MDPSKRDAILDAAVRCFGKVGFRKTSIDEIAQAAGVAKGTVYLACASKEDLFYQAVLRETRSFIAKVARALDPRVPADRQLETLALADFEHFQATPLVRDLFAGILYGELPGWIDRFDELRELGRVNLAELLRLGIRQGVFRGDLDVDETAAVLQDFQRAAYVLQTRRGDPVEPLALARRMKAGLSVVLDGLRTRPPAPR